MSCAHLARVRVRVRIRVRVRVRVGVGVRVRVRRAQLEGSVEEAVEMLLDGLRLVRLRAWA